MPQSSNPSSSTATPAPVSNAGETAVTTAQPLTLSEQNAVAAAFLAEGSGVVPVKTETTKETATETPAAETQTPDPQQTDGDEASNSEEGAAEAGPIAEPPENAGPEWLEKVREQIAETGEVPAWFFERAATPLIKEAEKNAKIRELESELVALKETAEAKPTIVVDNPDNAFAKLSPEELKSNETHFAAQRAWALRHLTTGGTAGDKEYGPEEAADLLLQAEQAIDLIKEAKTESESRRTHFEKVAKVAYPDLAVASSELRKKVDAIKIAKPSLARLVDSDTIIADMLEGQKLREARAKGIQTINVSAKPKPVASANGNYKTASPIAGAAPRVPISPVNSAPDIDSLRKQALNGSEKAQAALAAAFLQPAGA